MNHAHATDTIVAIATPPGAGGVGIVRMSGPRSLEIGGSLAGRTLAARTAHYTRFADADGSVIDDGIALAFPSPRSYTGEDVVELQAHGSPVLLQQLVARCCALGARIARPGEFSERAFLNGKLDLAQAEAVADLIAASDLRAARAARRSLDGEFSRRVDAIADALLAIRVHVEAMIDFVDEPIETLGAAQVQQRLVSMRAQLSLLLADAERGRKLRDGLHAVIVGPPNAGKSSLLNALAGSDRAIVTEIAGTTRDLLTETVRVAGIELTLVDTAGLREGGDAIEREGMRRARAELQRADLAIVVLDAADPLRGRDDVEQAISGVPAQLWLLNKIDLHADANPAADSADAPPAMLPLSARTGEGLDVLRQRLAALAGLDSGAEGSFSARQRQVDSLARAAQALGDAEQAWRQQALDLAAEALHQAHDALGDITGRILPDDLLGHIFSTFCIGK